MESLHSDEAVHSAIDDSKTSQFNGDISHSCNLDGCGKYQSQPLLTTREKSRNLKILCCDSLNGPTFFKGCLWSPDEGGNRILCGIGNNNLRVHHAFLNKTSYSCSQLSNDVYTLENIGKIFDYNWYPAASSSQYYVTVACSLGPLHVFDLLSKKSISSYQMYNRCDEIVKAHAVACSPDGSAIIGGTSDYLFLFDINRPGRTFDRILTRPYFNKGIISTIAVNPTRYSLFAVGSYNNRVGIYDDTDFLCLLLGHIKGVSHIKFSPDGTFLFSGTRGGGEIICWDMRNPGAALYKLERTVQTQQRIYFDISACGRFIASGSTDGNINIWDLKSPSTGNVLEPLHIVKAHEDCCNGVSFHQTLPLIASVSGQYHHKDLIDALVDSDEDDCKNIQYEGSIENKLKLWFLESLFENTDGI